MSRHETSRQIKDLLVPIAIGSNLPTDYLAGVTVWLDGQFLVRRPVDIGIVANRKTSQHDAKKECRQNGPSQFRQFPEQAHDHPSGHYEPNCRWLKSEAQDRKRAV